MTERDQGCEGAGRSERGEGGGTEGPTPIASARARAESRPRGAAPLLGPRLACCVLLASPVAPQAAGPQEEPRPQPHTA